MVQIGRRADEWCKGRLTEAELKVHQTFWKLQKSLKNHRIRISKFWSIIFSCLCLLCIVKKLDSIRTKLTEEIGFEVCPMAIPAMALLQQHDARRDILIEPAAWQGGVQRSKLGGIPNWGVRNWGCNRAVKTNRLVLSSKPTFQFCPVWCTSTYTTVQCKAIFICIYNRLIITNITILHQTQHAAIATDVNYHQSVIFDVSDIAKE